MRCRSLAAVLVLAAVAPAAAVPLQSWDKLVNKPGRFKVLSQFGGAAVLDTETGLVWEKAPDPGTSDWASAVFSCYNAVVGGRFGWRLPAIEELSSLVDPSQGGFVGSGGPPPLPAGHPFENIGAGAVFWALTTDVSNPGVALRMAIEVNSGLHGFVSGTAKTQSNIRRWCVRGGHGPDGR
jgi:hypothetical protein